jgi:hypothetical protein
MIRQCYVAGRYSGSPEEVHRNVLTALEAGAKIAEVRGWLPIIPHVQGDHRITWEEALTKCQGTILGLNPCWDMVVLLPGWEESRGARKEKQLAERLGLKILTLEEALGGA